MNEDVGNFDISVDDAMLCKIEQSFEDSFDIMFCLIFFHDFFGLEF